MNASAFRVAKTRHKNMARKRKGLLPLGLLLGQLRASYETYFYVREQKKILKKKFQKLQLLNI